MDIVQHPGGELLYSLLQSSAKPRERFTIARTQLIDGPVMQECNEALARFRNSPPAEVMTAVLRDGYDFLYSQQMFGLFSPARSVNASTWAVEQLRAAGAFEQAHTALAQAATLVEQALLPQLTQILIVPADPSNRNVMIRNSGLSVVGGAPGFLAVAIWPGAGNLARLGPAVVRAFALGVHWHAINASSHYTLADALAAEGRAATVVAKLFPAEPLPWLVAHTPPASWSDDLAAVAQLYGVASYSAVPANLYGASDVQVEPPPAGVVLTHDERDYCIGVINGAITTTDPRTIAAHLYGDQIVGAQGHPQAGLPPYAGFEIAFRSYKTASSGW